MNRKTINAVIILGAVSLISIMAVQVLWIQRTGAIQATNVALQVRQDSLNLDHFAKRTNIALRRVLHEISANIKDSSDHYASVKQIESDFYSVDLNYTVDLDREVPLQYLENLLSFEFDNQQVREDFRVAMYDCFTEVTTFSELLHFDTIFKRVSDPISAAAHRSMMTKKNDHYFTVYFPTLKASSVGPEIEDLVFPYYYVIGIVVLVLVFFIFTINVILRQKRLSEIKTDFINNMTHELKTPISTIGLSAEMIMRNDFTKDEEKLKQYAGIIYKENKRLEHQVERVLKVAKLEKDKISLTKESFDMHEMIEEVKDNFDFNQNEKGGTIQLHLNAERPVINVDPVHLSNVVYNLIDNAVKYCKETPAIQIRTSSDKRYFYVEIEDNAIGMKREDLKMIFDKFYRVPTGNLHDVKGFGLGLHYVKLIIDEHGGTISVRSTLGKGSVFGIKLPF